MDKRLSASENRWMIVLMIVGMLLLLFAVVGYVHAAEAGSSVVNQISCFYQRS